jgi:Methylamine utilisation protein MauE
LAYLVVGCRCLVGLVFLVAAASKLHSRAAFGGFGESLRQLPLVPKTLAVPAAVGVVVAEAVVPLLLVAPAAGFAAAGFAVALGLLSAFTATTVIALRRGARPPCRCFGMSEIPLGARHVVRNCALAAVAGVGLAAALQGGQRAVDPAGVAVAAVAGIVLAVLAVVFDDLVELFGPRAAAAPGTRLEQGGSHAVLGGRGHVGRRHLPG